MRIRKIVGAATASMVLATSAGLAMAAPSFAEAGAGWGVEDAPESNYTVGAVNHYTNKEVQITGDPGSTADIRATIPQDTMINDIVVSSGDYSMIMASIDGVTYTGWLNKGDLREEVRQDDLSVQYAKTDSPVRTGTTETATVIDDVATGEKVEMLQISADWIHVTTDEVHGWIPYSVIFEGEPETNPDPVDPPEPEYPADVDIKDYAGWVKESTKVYEKPSTKTPVSFSLGKWSKITVTHTAGEFSKIKSGSRTGYILTSSITDTNVNSFAVYGTLRDGQSANHLMNGHTAFYKNLGLKNTSLYQLWEEDWTFVVTGKDAVVSEQFVYDEVKGPKMLAALDEYEVIRYQGKNMYERTMMEMTDGSHSWAYRTSAWGEAAAKSMGRYIASADFLQRS